MCQADSQTALLCAERRYQLILCVVPEEVEQRKLYSVDAVTQTHLTVFSAKINEPINRSKMETDDKTDDPLLRSVNLCCFRLLAEEEDKMKALMSLQEEQEEYILKTEREKQELKQEMEAKSRSLEEAQRQLEEVRANRHRVDQDVVVRLYRKTTEGGGAWIPVGWNASKAI